MAVTYEVETWSELVAAFTNGGETITDGSRIIKLMNDIDCNAEIPEGVAETLLAKYNVASDRYVEINGEYKENGETKRRKIINLRTHIINPVKIFRVNNISSGDSAGAGLTLRGIDFINLILDQRLASGVRWASTSPLAATNCRFVGKRSTNIFDSEYYGANIVLTSCFFNVPYKSSEPTFKTFCIAKPPDGKNRIQKAYYCYFVESDSGLTPDDTKPCTSFGKMQLSGCRAEGETTFGDVLTFTDQSMATTRVQNVMDIDLKTTATEGTTITVNAPYGVWRDDIHSTDSAITNTYEYTNVNGDNYSIPETPERMKDAEALSKDGLDIGVGSESGDET